VRREGGKSMARKKRERSTEVGRKIKELREEREWSLSELAKLASVSRSYLYRIEIGKSSPTEDKLRSIANALGVTLSNLLEDIKPFDEMEIPDSLRKFAQEENLPSADIEMLAKLSYRGNQPASVEQWRILYRVIKATLEPKS